ncbi:unnamed protein product [Phyllotreta striolata]|uniref:Epoxide hydrolase n=1 Tax=Phyllotreta striolata TaxID=444603 RepID=A0A9N9TJE6_PHYSR|nr:unnamed protein product [Phyllotreta striolata]
MGTCGVVTAVLMAIFVGYSYVKIKPLLEFPEKPDLGEKWWKASKPGKVDTTIRPFKIQVSDQILDDLKYRLDKTMPFQRSLEGTAQHYGMNDKLIADIVDFWKTKYDWKQREKLLNKYPQFKTNIQGLDIHFIRVKPAKTAGVKVVPLLLLHGWPGSVREFYEAIPILSAPKKGQKFAFELIVPSLPGFGFSEAAEVPGLSIHEMAVVMKNLMGRLGFDKYYVQGGDWGGIIAHCMSVLFPEKIIAMHSNFCVANGVKSMLKLAAMSYFPSLAVEEKYQHLVFPRMEKMMDLNLELGYLHIQATKPDTIGVALRESPAGLAAYIIEKFTSWTDPKWKGLEDGGLTKKFKMEDILDNVMIYWVTRSMTTSLRVYAETFNKASYALMVDYMPTEVLAGCAAFTNEMIFFPESILKDKYPNLIHYTVIEGGHFAAFEEPQLYADDVVQFVNKVENMQQKPPTS